MSDNIITFVPPGGHRTADIPVFDFSELDDAPPVLADEAGASAIAYEPDLDEIARRNRTALSVLTMLQSQFDGTGNGQFSDDVICGMIAAATDQLEAIRLQVD